MHRGDYEMKEYGLVLSGGGTKGAFEIGVWKALIEQKIPISCVIGTSIGAVNAALIAQNDFDMAYQSWNNLEINQVLNLNTSMAQKYVQQWSGISFDSFRLSFLNDLFRGDLDITPLRHFLARAIDEDKIRRSPIKLGLVTVELDTLKPVQLMIDDIPKGKLLDYLLASSALPVFQKQEIDGKTYLDGGFYDNLPINFMVESGYTDIIAVEFPAMGFKQKVKGKNLDITVVTNSEYLGMTLQFDQETIQNNITMGYLDCLRTFGCVKGKIFYINPDDAHMFYDKLTDFIGRPLADPNARSEIATLLGIPEDATQYTTIEAIQRMVKRTTYNKTKNTMLSLLEMTGKCVNVPRMKIYSPDHFILEILTSLETLTRSNLAFIKNDETIQKALSEDTDDKPTTLLDFLSFYVLFVGSKTELPIGILQHLKNKFTPEYTLGMMMLIYIHQVINDGK